jgi:hypothetical protein
MCSETKTRVPGRGQGVRAELTGQTRGRLRVLGPTGRVDEGGVWWLCECARGHRVEATTTALNSGKRRTCGQPECAPTLRRPGHAQCHHCHRVGHLYRDADGNPACEFHRAPRRRPHRLQSLLCRAHGCDEHTQCRGKGGTPLCERHGGVAKREQRTAVAA